MSCYITQVGNSALMAAAGMGKTEVGVELVKAGANVDMQNAVRTFTYMYKHNVCLYTCKCVYMVHVYIYIWLS